MKKTNFFLIMICMLLCLLSVGCGKEAKDYTVGSADLEFYNINSMREELFKGRGEEEGSGILLGMQYYKGEPVQIRQLYEEGTSDIYLCRSDGSRELLMENLQVEDIASWYLEEDGSVYCWKRSLEVQLEENAPFIQKLNGEGEEIFRRELGQDLLLWDLCRMEDGSILLLLQEGRDGELKLAEMNPANGSLSEKPGVKLGQSPYAKYIAAGSQGVLVMDPVTPVGIIEVNMEDGSVFSASSFSGTSYSLEDGPEGMAVSGFCMKEEGEAEILWADPVSGRGIRETLQLSKMKKTPIILQTTYLMDGGWLETRASEFNRSNSRYHVIVEYPRPADQVDFGTGMAVQIAVGKGPDILYGYALDFVPDLAVKGGLEDLAPYMEESGIQEEDYYPYAFSCLRDGENIYTFRLKGTPSFSCINKELLEGWNVSDIESLLDALLAWEGEALFGYGRTSGSMLRLFYCSDDFWGMIDWDNGTCDFSGELFAKILQVTKKYGLPYDKSFSGDFPTGLKSVFKSISCSLYGFKTSAELEEMGLVNLNAFLINNDYPDAGGMDFALAINANSAQKEGAWEFIRYLMSEEVQGLIAGEDMTNKKSYEKWIKQVLADMQGMDEDDIVGEDYKSITVLSNGEVIEEAGVLYTKKDITQERIEELLKMRENAWEDTTIEYARMKPIYNIMEEEAEYYFKGAKSLEEVVDIINSRVGLYVGEQH